jgi:hypothetical protein
VSPINQELLRRHGFHAPKPEAPKIFASVCGMAKSGKTHLALGAPGPVAFFGFENTLSTLAPKFPGKEFQEIAFRVPVHAESAEEAHAKLAAKTVEERKTLAHAQAAKRALRAADEALDEWERFKKAWVDCLSPGSGFRSVVVDTGTAMWELATLARFGKTVQVPQILRGALNAEFRGMLQMAGEARGVNVLLTHRMKQEFVGGDNAVWTGRHVFSGFKDIPYELDLSVEVARDVATAKQIGAGERAYVYHARVTDCRRTPDALGVEMWADATRDAEEEWDAMGAPTDPDFWGHIPMTFPALAKLVFPETPFDAWRG